MYGRYSNTEREAPNKSSRYGAINNQRRGFHLWRENDLEMGIPVTQAGRETHTGNNSFSEKLAAFWLIAQQGKPCQSDKMRVTSIGDLPAVTDEGGCEAPALTGVTGIWAQSLVTNHHGRLPIHFDNWGSKVSSWLHVTCGHEMSSKHHRVLTVQQPWGERCCCPPLTANRKGSGGRVTC